ncbi:MAG: sulfotransferase domain-containing protein [Flavobacteriales bacterium]
MECSIMIGSILPSLSGCPISKPVLINSLPKSGTHMLSNMISAIPKCYIKKDVTNADKILDHHQRLTWIKGFKLELLNPGDIIVGHIPYSYEMEEYLNELNVYHLFIYRDPRDVLVSLYRYVQKAHEHVYRNILDGLSEEQQYGILIEGFGEGKSGYVLNPNAIPALSFFCGAYQSWINSSAKVFRYEKFVLNGTRHESIASLAKVLGVPKRLEGQMLKALVSKSSSTFSRGIVGSWKEEVPPSLVGLLELQLNILSADFFWNET